MRRARRSMSARSPIGATSCASTSNCWAATAEGRPDMATLGVGARLPRKEDDRFLRGRGEFVGDIKLPGMQEVAFVRSPIAHGRIRAITIPDAIRSQVSLAADLTGVEPIRCYTALAGFKCSDQPVLAAGKVRHVGELVAMCVAPTRAEAGDLGQQVVGELHG